MLRRNQSGLFGLIRLGSQGGSGGRFQMETLDTEEMRSGKQTLPGRTPPPPFALVHPGPEAPRRRPFTPTPPSLIAQLWEPESFLKEWRRYLSEELR